MDQIRLLPSGPTSSAEKAAKEKNKTTSKKNFLMGLALRPKIKKSTGLSKSFC